MYHTDEKKLYKDAGDSGAIEDIIYLDNGDEFQRDGYLIQNKHDYHLIENGAKME